MGSASREAGAREYPHTRDLLCRNGGRSEGRSLGTRMRTRPTLGLATAIGKHPRALVSLRRHCEQERECDLQAGRP